MGVIFLGKRFVCDIKEGILEIRNLIFSMNCVVFKGRYYLNVGLG